MRRAFAKCLAVEAYFSLLVPELLVPELLAPELPVPPELELLELGLRTELVLVLVSEDEPEESELRLVP